jgi:hypothetical protein
LHLGSDTSPHATGTAVSFRSGNSTFRIDDFKIFRSRAASTPILVGAANTNDFVTKIFRRTYTAEILVVLQKITPIIFLPSVINTLILTGLNQSASSIIKDGTANDIDTTYVGTQLDLNYTMAEDTNSGVASYYYAIGTTAGSQNITSWTLNNLNLSATKTGLILVNNQKYYIMVKAINNAGLVSDSTVSDGVIYLMSTGIEENNALNELSIYPNPVNDKATISLISSSEEKINYNLFDAQGKLIEEKVLDIHSGINTLEINVIISYK